MGATGPAGATGAIGATGATGPTGIVSTSFNHGLGSNPTASLAFLSSTLTVTVTATQKVFVTGTKAFGSTTAGGATGLKLYICYQSTAVGSPIVNVGSGLFKLGVVQNIRFPFSLSADFATPAAGTYLVGLCGSTSTAAEAVNWNDNEWSYVTAIVHN